MRLPRRRAPRAGSPRLRPALFLAGATVVLTALAVPASGAAVAAQRPTGATVAADGTSAAAGATSAVITEFGPDVIGPDNGLPAKPGAPLAYGQPTMVVDDAGDTVDAHEGKLVFLGGRYWLYGDAYGCGYRFQIPGLPLPGTSAGFCGLNAYSSLDLQRWHRVRLRMSTALTDLCERSGCFQPRIIYSPRLDRYLMWLAVARPDTGSHYYVAQSRAPEGPWGDPAPARLARPANNDYDVYVDHQGRGWVTATNLDFTDPTRNAVSVERLDDTLTSGTGAAVVVASGARQAPSLFQRGGRYHLTVSDPVCAYCRAATATYLADDPLGPWTTPGTGDGSTAGEAPSTIVSADSCGGQPRAVSELPGPDGPIYLLQNDLWRTSPDDFGWLGDRNQAVAGRYWTTLRFDDAGDVLPYPCLPEVSIPLAPDTRTHGTAGAYVLDCRAESGGSMRQQWTVPPGRYLTAVSLPVFQRPHDNADITQRLQVEIRADGRVVGGRSFDPAEVSWAPRQETLPLQTVATPGQVVSLLLTSAESSGCFGGLVGVDQGGQGTYAAGSEPTSYPGAALSFRPSYVEVPGSTG